MQWVEDAPTYGPLIDGGVACPGKLQVLTGHGPPH